VAWRDARGGEACASRANTVSPKVQIYRLSQSSNMCLPARMEAGTYSSTKTTLYKQ